ncbi:hypothetical protein YC2023_032521 [Brassica napus]
MFYQIQPYRPLSKISISIFLSFSTVFDSGTGLDDSNGDTTIGNSLDFSNSFCLLCWLLEQIWTTGSFCIPKDVFETSKEADEIGAARGVSVEQCLSIDGDGIFVAGCVSLSTRINGWEMNEDGTGLAGCVSLSRSINGWRWDDGRHKAL